MSESQHRLASAALLIAASAAIGYSLGRGSVPQPVIVACAGEHAPSPAASSGGGLLAWLVGPRPVNVPVAAPGRRDEWKDTRSDPRTAGILEAEQSLRARATSPSFSPFGYEEPLENVPVWKKLEGSSWNSSSKVGATLEEALDQFKSLTGLGVVVDWEALASVGLSQGRTAVGADPGASSLARALGRILASVVDRGTMQGPSESLGFDVQDGLVVVSTAQKLRESQVTCVYEVWDLCMPSQRIDHQISAKYRGFDDSWIPDVPEYVENLRYLLVDRVDANWEDRGLGTDCIEVFRGDFVVTASRPAHREIASLLHQLRRARLASGN